MEGEPSVPTIEALSETKHLKEGIPPIIACVGTESDYKDQLDKLFVDYDLNRGDVHNVDYYMNSDILDLKGYKNEGQRTYVISLVDPLNKFSENFSDCTGLIVIGKKANGNENISILSHQDPDKFLLDKREDFIHHLEETLQQIKDDCEEGTIDSIIVGGRYLPYSDNSKRESWSEKGYVQSINLLSEEVRKYFGFDPVIVNGPKLPAPSIGRDKVYLDTQNRRVYYIRPRINSDMPDFTQPELDEKRKDWKEAEF